MIARVEININLRINGDQTIVDLDEDVFGPIAEYDRVEVFESSSGIVGQGWIIQINEQERTARLGVDWANLRLPAGNQPQGFLRLRPTDVQQLALGYVQVA